MSNQNDRSHDKTQDSKIQKNENGQNFIQFKDEDDHIDIEKKMNHKKDTEQGNAESSRSQDQTTMNSESDLFMQSLMEVLGQEEGKKLTQMLQQLPPEQMTQMEGMMSQMPEDQVQQQLDMMKGMTAEQVMGLFEQFSKMNPKELQQMQDQMQNMDENDKKAMKVFMEIDEELNELGKPWRWLNEYGFYGFSVHTFSFQVGIAIMIVYMYIQQIILRKYSGYCQEALAGAVVPYLVIEKGEYYRFFTSMFVYNSWTHVFVSVTNAWYLFFMIERPLQHTFKFIGVLVMGQLYGMMFSILIAPDEPLIGLAAPINTITTLFFFFCWKYRDMFLSHKIYLYMMGSYFFYYIWTLFANPEKISFHLGAALFGVLVQPFIFSMDWKLPDWAKLVYKILIVSLVVIMCTLSFYITVKQGPQTQLLFDQCPQLLE